MRNRTHTSRATLTGLALLALTVHGNRPAIAEPAADITVDATDADPVSSPPPAAPAAPPTQSRLWPVLAASGPGLLFHGAGHMAAGETKTGWHLLAMEGIGVGSILAGLGGLKWTGASPKTVVPFIGMVAFGTGLFTSSFLADIYGVSAPAGGTGSPMLRPRLEFETGARYVNDPVFAYDVFAYQAILARWRRMAVLGQAFIGLDHNNQRLRLVGAHELWRGSPITSLWLELGVVHHRFGTEQFATTFGELAVAGRYDMGRLGHTLDGAFIDAALGYAMGANRQFDLTTEFDDMTLARIGFGIYLGHRADRGGEASFYYDHRHDGFAAGLKLPGISSGPAGHLGIRAAYYLSTSWGLAAQGEVGSAHVIGLSLLYRAGTVQ